jgi:hypothetical protein
MRVELESTARPAAVTGASGCWRRPRRHDPPISLLPPLTEEDAAARHDRSRVHHARGHRKRWHLLWLLVGPGILAMLGENDGPSMIAYASDGAQYGLGFFVPFIPVLFAMAYVCQEMCMRVGAVTHRGYGELVLQRYGKVWGWFGAGDLTVTNLVTLIAEFVAIRVGLAYFHLGSGVAVALGLTLVVFTLSGGRYWRWERIVLGLALFNGLFLVAAILVKPHGRRDRRLARLQPAPRRQLQHAAAAAGLDDRRDGDAVDDLLPAERLGRQGHDPGDIARPLRHRAGAVLAAIFGVGALIAGAALLTHHGSASRASRAPASRRRCARRGRRGRDGVRARADRGRRGRDPHDLGQHRLRRRENASASPTASTAHRAAPPSSTPRTSASRCSPRSSS